MGGTGALRGLPITLKESLNVAGLGTTCGVTEWKGFVSKHDNAYTYLPESVLAFPGPDAVAATMRSNGFKDVKYERLFGGIVAIHVGTRE